MQQVLSRRGALAAFLAMFALAFSLFAGATPAQAADDDLTAGGANLATQADSTYSGITWPFKVYVINEGETDATLVKSYTEEEFAALATTDGDPISSLWWKAPKKEDADQWIVGTAITYVKLDDLLSNAGVTWGSGASITYGGDPSQGKAGNTFTYDELQDLYFYPKTGQFENNTEGAIKVPFVFGLKTSNKGVAIDETETAADVAKKAETTNVTTQAPYALVGSKEAEYKAKSGTTVAGKRSWAQVDSICIIYGDDTTDMYRLYNPNSGEHLYTLDANEYAELAKLGWKQEGTGWTAPKISTVPVYRLYNPYSGDHHYTTDANEYASLGKIGWKQEGTGFYSDDAKGTTVYRLFNPNETIGTHHYTLDQNEYDTLGKGGWKQEGTAWYGVKAAEASAEK